MCCPTAGCGKLLVPKESVERRAEVQCPMCYDLSLSLSIIYTYIFMVVIITMIMIITTMNIYDKVQCPMCYNLFCTACGNPSHRPLDCDEAELQLNTMMCSIVDCTTLVCTMICCTHYVVIIVDCTARRSCSGWTRRSARCSSGRAWYTMT